MSKKPAGSSRARDRATPRSGGRETAADPARDVPPLKPLPPFKPRPRLFFGLLAALAVWTCLLLGLYFLTVFPNRNVRHDATAPVAPDGETVAR